MIVGRVARAALVAIGALGCGSTEPPRACGAGEESKGVCVRTVPTCAEGQRPVLGGGCVTVGPKACPAGFDLVAATCRPVLPDRCPEGQMALPGKACAPVGDCAAAPPAGVATWVDASYAGADADGSKERPFPKIGPALLRGGLVWVAAGTYAEDLVIDRPTKLVGACPATTRIVGQGATFAIDVTADATVRGLSVTGPETAIGVAKRAVVELRELVVHDAGNRGIDVEDVGGVPDVTLVDSLVSGCGRLGVYAEGSTLTVARSVVRDSRLLSGTKSAEGILARQSLGKRPSSLRLLESVVEGNAGLGVAVTGSHAEIVDTVVRRTKPTGVTAAAAIVVFRDERGGTSDAVLRGVTVLDSDAIGVEAIDAALTVEGCTFVELQGLDATSLSVENTDLVLRDTTVGGIAGIAVSLRGSRAEVSGLFVRDVALQPTGVGGVGIALLALPPLVSRTTLTNALVTRTRTLGIAAVAVELVGRDLAVLDVGTTSDARLGDGVNVSSGYSPRLDAVVPGKGELTDVLVARVARAGISAFGSELTLRGAYVGCSRFPLSVSRHVNITPDKTWDRDVVLHDEGGNVCGCAAFAECRAVQDDLEPLRLPE